MNYVTFSTDTVEAIHQDILNPGELPGHARDKSLEGALARVDNRLAYGLITDAFDLAAAYCVALATGHCFNDGNKRTAFRVLNAALVFNGIRIVWTTETIGEIVIRTAQRQLDEGELADWLRARAG